MNLIKNKRYSFWKVFWVVLAVYIFFAFLGMIASFIASSPESHYSIKRFVTWRNLLSQLYGLIYLSGFYYYTANIYYDLIAQKRSTFKFVQVSVIALLGLAVYYTGYYFITDKKPEKELTVGLIIFSFAVS